jgi:GH25 family lysozyme M1 (1,4-beta-N-acetylmuramidase)
MPEYFDTWSQTRMRTIGNLSALQRMQLALIQPVPTLISGLDATKLALMVDISHWQGDVDIQRMVTEGHISALSPKMSDGKQVRDGGAYELTNYIDDKFYANVQKCYDAKVPCLPYHYVQPMFTDYTAQGVLDWNWKVMQAAVKPLVAGKSYHALVLDVEEKNTTSPNAATVVMGLLDRMSKDPDMSKVPAIVYSSMGVLNYYPTLRDQLSYQGANRNLWMAQWVYNTTTTCTWDAFWSNYVPKIEMKILTPGFANWKAVQWSSSFVLPGGSGRTDVSSFCMTQSQLNDWLKFTPGTTPEPEPEPEPEPGEVTLAAFEALTARVIDIEAWKAKMKEANA